MKQLDTYSEYSLDELWSVNSSACCLQIVAVLPNVYQLKS